MRKMQELTIIERMRERIDIPIELGGIKFNLMWMLGAIAMLLVSLFVFSHQHAPPLKQLDIKDSQIIRASGSLQAMMVKRSRREGSRLEAVLTTQDSQQIRFPCVAVRPLCDEAAQNHAHYTSSIIHDVKLECIKVDGLDLPWPLWIEAGGKSLMSRDESAVWFEEYKETSYFSELLLILLAPILAIISFAVEAGDKRRAITDAPDDDSVDMNAGLIGGIIAGMIDPDDD